MPHGQLKKKGRKKKDFSFEDSSLEGSAGSLCGRRSRAGKLSERQGKRQHTQRHFKGKIHHLQSKTHTIQTTTKFQTATCRRQSSPGLDDCSTTPFPHQHTHTHATHSNLVALMGICDRKVWPEQGYVIEFKFKESMVFAFRA